MGPRVLINGTWYEASQLVMAGLVPAIHVFLAE